MDTSETYIKMCDMSEEIQDKYKPTLGDFAVRSCEYGHYQVGLVAWRYDQHSLWWMIFNGDDGITLNGENSQSNYLEKLIWLPRQDQLQKMISNDACICFTELLKWYAKYELIYILPKISNSMEQLWLAFVMDTKFGKRWNGEIWS